MLIINFILYIFLSRAEVLGTLFSVGPLVDLRKLRGAQCGNEFMTETRATEP